MGIPERREDDCLSAVARAFKRRRRELRLTQMDVARRGRLSQSLIARVESGRSNITLASLVRVAHALQSDLDLSLSPWPWRSRKEHARRESPKVEERDDPLERVSRYLSTHPAVDVAIPQDTEGTLDVLVLFRAHVLPEPGLLAELGALAGRLLGSTAFRISYLDPRRPGDLLRWVSPSRHARPTRVTPPPVTPPPFDSR